ncbi:MAG: response regulator [Candidatus Omnitrophica bacterium]|nr:response regulator [Candidatus Omnitrophota bacterium]
MARVLIIDDDLPTCDFLKMYLTKKGYEAKWALSGEDGIEVAETYNPHIVFLDVDLGKGHASGLEILQRLKSRNDTVAVIMMTANDDPASIDYAKEQGAFEYVIKPFSLDYLERDVLPKILNQLI